MAGRILWRMFQQTAARAPHGFRRGSRLRRPHRLPPSLADLASKTGKLMAGQRHVGSGEEQKSQIMLRLRTVGKDLGNRVEVPTTGARSG